MKFMITYSIDTVHDRSAIARFLETGAPPPEGVTMLGRWHAGGHGWILAESSAARGIIQWISQWSDLIKFTTDPILEDAEMADVLKGLNSG